MAEKEKTETRWERACRLYGVEAAIYAVKADRTCTWHELIRRYMSNVRCHEEHD